MIGVEEQKTQQERYATIAVNRRIATIADFGTASIAG